MSVCRVGTPALAGGAVVTSDYMPWARVTAGSFMEHHPGARFVVMIVDDPDPSGDEPFELRTPTEIGMSTDEFEWMKLIYDGLELCCALKPLILRHLLAEADAAIYLDSDVFVCGSLHDVAARATRAGVVLSPHALEPRREINEDTLLEVGQFNAGFVAVGRAGLAFIDWWSDKLARECPRFDVGTPLRFLDQRWLDLVVNYFPCEIDRDPGANLAYWNLPQRTLRRSPDGYQVDGSPLKFFHFSGFSPADPVVLARSCDPYPRIEVEPASALEGLVDEYVERLMSAGWRADGRRRSPSECAGIVLTTPVRAAVRAALVEAERVGAAPAAGPRDAQALRAWLSAPTTAAGTSWYLRGLWISHRGVRHAFPHVPGPDEQRYLSWSSTAGVAAGLVPPGFAGPANPLNLDGARSCVVMLDASEARADPGLLSGIADQFSAGDDMTLLLAAPGQDAGVLLRDFEPLLAEFGLSGPDAPDMLAVVDPVGPGAMASQVHAILTRRPVDVAFAGIPCAADAVALRRVVDVALPSDSVAAIG